MAERKPSKVGWTSCKAAMKGWPQAGVVALVQELYKLSESNRTFLHARLVPEGGTAFALASAVNRLDKMLAPGAVLRNRFRHVDAKRVVDGFDRATDDKGAVAKLILADLGFAMRTNEEFGDVPELVDHCFAMLRRLGAVLGVLDVDPLVEASDDLTALSNRYSDAFGYGLSDELTASAAECRVRMRAAMDRQN